MKYLLSLKNDFVFKLIFGDEKNKDVLVAFLSAVLNMPEEEFQGLEIINTELLREFKEDKKGILDVRVKTKFGKQIDIEIQILPNAWMAERTLYYWSKMYSGQIKEGDDYERLKKCVTINIVDFECVPVKMAHTVFHVTEDRTGHKLTDVLEIHYLELPKLEDEQVRKEDDEIVVDWMMFIDAESEGVMEMLAEKNVGIKKAYNILKIVSQDEKARMLYEARQAELMDQMTRIKEAEKRGREEGETKRTIEIAKNLLLAGVDFQTIVATTGLDEAEIVKLKEEQH